jgi:hypothetical protein
MMLEN